MNGFWIEGVCPKYIFISEEMAEYIRGYRNPFESVANRAWLFRTFGLSNDKRDHFDERLGDSRGRRRR